MKPALRLPMVLGLLGSLVLIGSIAWAKITVSETSLTFPDTSVGSSSQMSVTVTGVGGAASNSVKVTGAQGAFSATPTSFHVKKNHSVTVTFTFTPTAGGPVSQTVQINSKHVDLTGSGVVGPTATPTATQVGPTVTPTVTPTATPTPGAISGSQPVPMGITNRLWIP